MTTTITETSASLQTADSRVIRLGVVGTRNIGRNHIRNGVGVEGAEIVAVVDTDPARVQAVGEEFGVKHRFQNVEDLWNCDEVDGVILALPNHLHAPLSIAAMRAGKHVLVEKPVARTVAEADEMIAVSEATGKTLMVGMHIRLRPLSAALKSAIAAGTIGEPLAIQTGWMEARPSAGLWQRGDWSLTKEGSGGGPLLDLGIHRLDFALHLLGFPEVDYVCGQCFYGIGRAEAEKRGKIYEVEDSAVGYIHFRNGSTMTLEASYFHNTPNTGSYLRIVGSRGCVTMPGDNPLMVYENDALAAAPLELDDTVSENCAKHFVRVLQGREELIPTAPQAREGLRIIEAIYESAETGRPVYLSKSENQKG